MKTINETFTEEEFQKLKTVKGNKSWHEFILKVANNQKLSEKGGKKNE
jgi:hypothetical protein